MHGDSGVSEGINGVDGGAVDRGSQDDAILAYGEVFDPGFVWEGPDCAYCVVRWVRKGLNERREEDEDEGTEKLDRRQREHCGT